MCFVGCIASPGGYLCNASTVEYEIVSFSVQNYTESTDKSQNIVEQANSNPNNTSLTMSRRHIICNSSILTEMNQKFHS